VERPRSPHTHSLLTAQENKLQSPRLSHPGLRSLDGSQNTDGDGIVGSSNVNSSTQNNSEPMELEPQSFHSVDSLHNGEPLNITPNQPVVHAEPQLPAQSPTTDPVKIEDSNKPPVSPTEKRTPEPNFVLLSNKETLPPFYDKIHDL